MVFFFSLIPYLTGVVQFNSKSESFSFSHPNVYEFTPKAASATIIFDETKTKQKVDKKLKKKKVEKKKFNKLSNLLEIFQKMLFHLY